jgi:hypothetical protein
MGTKTKKVSKVMQEVKEAMKNETDGFPDDGAFIPGPIAGRTQRILPLAFRKDPDEIAIDEMLLGLDKSQGWYLKLQKETIPGEWQFKRRIDNFRGITDLEAEVNNIVRGETEAEIKRVGRCNRWGTGKYRIVFWNDNGIRGDKKMPVIFDIDAQEDMFLPVGTASAAKDTADIVEIVKQVQGAHPGLNPAEVNAQTAEMFKKGLELGAGEKIASKSGEKDMLMLVMNQQSKSQELMLGLITALLNKPSDNKGPDARILLNETLSTLKNFGVLEKPIVTPQKPLIEQINELKALGIIKTPADEQDFIGQFDKFKTFANLAMDLFGARGGGEAATPSIWERVIEKIPFDKIPQILKDARAIAEKAALASQPSPSYVVENQQPPLPGFGDYDGTYHARPDVQPVGQPVGTQPTGGLEDQMWLNRLAEELWTYVAAQNEGAFPRITEVLSGFFGTKEEMVQKARSKGITADTLVSYILKFDNVHYRTPGAQQYLKVYTDKYVSWLTGNGVKGPSISSTSDIVAKCSTCGAEYAFTQGEWDSEVQTSGGMVPCDHNGCQGTLNIIQGAVSGNA